MIRDFYYRHGIATTFFIGLGIFILMAALSFLFFTFGYWLITLILWTFFSFALPFSWWYSLGAWLIALIMGGFILPSNLVKYNRD